MKKNLKIGFYILVFSLSFFVGYVSLPRPMVSVIMPTYNRANFLPRAIDSILNQTYKDFEFIIVDDGSTDNTPYILKKYAQQDSRIRILRNKKNSGIPFTRNKGQQAARGKYIAIMDSDDISLPTRLEKQVAHLEKNPELAFVIGQTQNQKNDIVWWRPTDTAEIIWAMHFDNGIGNPQTLIRRSFLKKNNIRYNEEYAAAEDYDFWKQIIFKGGKFERINEPVIAIRYHGENSAKYYGIQEKTRNRVSKEFFAKYGIDWSGKREPTCDIILQMIDNNKANLLSDSFLKTKKEVYCFQ